MSNKTLTPRQLLAQALCIANGFEKLPKLPKTTLQKSDKLTRDDVMLGVDLLKIFYNFPSGNSGGRNLYDLMDLYLRDDVARERMNEVIRDHGKIVH